MKKIIEKLKHDLKHRRALSKAQYRGEVAEEWYRAGNKLTNETMFEFRKFMKQADKEWEKANK